MQMLLRLRDLVHMVQMNIAPAYAENWMILFGPLLIMVVLFGRGGLIGLLDKAGFARIGKRKMAVK